MPYVEQYDAASKKLEALNTSFPEQLKKSILQQAVEGKLVPQDPSDEPASILLKKIDEERQRLIKEGKIKKQKKLPEITEDEIPFDIPESWSWQRLGEITRNHGQKKPDNLFSYIDIGSDNIISPENAPSRARKIVKYGDIIYATVRPYLHNMCIIDRNFKYEPIVSTGFAVLKCYEGVNNKYLFYYLQSPAFDVYANSTENSRGVAYPAINDKKLFSSAIPIPPLAEQKRIVEKIEEILPYCEMLK